MKFSAAVVLAAASSALAASNVTVVTQTVQSLVTYCPSATTIVQNSKTYTVTKVSTRLAKTRTKGTSTLT